MKIIDYKTPSDFEEVFALLKREKKAEIIAGGLFLRLQKKTIPLVIDLSNLGLDKIEEEENCYKLGAMVTLREIEKSKILPKALTESVRQISGVGTRNLATIGGSICGRYPFSDIDTALLALDSDLEFYQHKEMSMSSFILQGLEEKDLLMYVRIPKVMKSRTKCYKQVYTDFSLVNVSVCKDRVAIGARPERAIAIENVDLKQPVHKILQAVDFGDDYNASGAYRRVLAETLLEEIIKEMEA